MYIGQSLVEGTHIPESRFTTAQAWMSALDRITSTFVPFNDTASIVGVRSFAADLIQAVAPFGIFVVETLDKQTCIEIGTAVTGIVYAAAIEHLRASESIKLRYTVVGQHIDNDARHDIGDGRAALHVHQRFAFDQLVYGFCPSGVWIGSLYAAGRGAIAPRNDRFGTFGAFFDNLHGTFPTDTAIGLVFSRNGPLDHQDVFTPIFLHGFLLASFGLEAGGCHQRFRIVKRDIIEQQVPYRGMIRSDERFATAGAFLQMKPDNRKSRLCFQCFYYLCHTIGFESDQSGNSGTEFQEIPAGDAFLQAFFVDRQSFIFHILVYFVDSS